ncbi:MAG: indole-3-glycerol phosphate synthase TrpC [Paracoccaceae bacterium]
MPSILDTIRASKLEEVRERKSRVPPGEMERRARAAPAVRPFADSLKSAAGTGYGLIAEIKKASPSKGLIRPDFEPAALARAYETGGAACLSVLTDGPFFKGAGEYLAAARAATGLPVLRKDFMYDTYQVAEARAMGADCILVIMASVSDAQAGELEDAATEWSMDVLVEVHNKDEMDRALDLRSPLLGINNRDLNTFGTDLRVTERLAADAPPDRLVVSESGLNARADLSRLAARGVRAFLIGEYLMRQPDVEAATRALLSDPVPVEAL